MSQDYEKDIREIKGNPIIIPYSVLLHRVKSFECIEKPEHLCAVVIEHAKLRHEGILLYAPAVLNITPERVHAICTPDVGAEKMKIQSGREIVTLRFFSKEDGRWMVNRRNCCVFIRDKNNLRLAIFDSTELNFQQLSSYELFLALFSEAFKSGHPEELI